MQNLNRFITLSQRMKKFKIPILNRSKSDVPKTVAGKIENGVFGKYLLYTNIASGGILMFLGDLLEQEIEYRRNLIWERYDNTRLFNMTLVGLSQGPLHHYFYIYLHKFFPRRTLDNVIKKILMDQFVMSPLCIVTFFYTICYLNKQSLLDSTQELKNKFLQVYMVDWCVWPPTQFINFFLIPIRYQVLYINGVTTLYNVFLSYIKYQHESHVAIAETVANPGEKDIKKPVLTSKEL